MVILAVKFAMKGLSMRLPSDERSISSGTVTDFNPPRLSIGSAIGKKAVIPVGISRAVPFAKLIKAKYSYIDSTFTNLEKC